MWTNFDLIIGSVTPSRITTRLSGADELGTAAPTMNAAATPTSNSGHANGQGLMRDGHQIENSQRFMSDSRNRQLDTPTDASYRGRKL
jgi:hypothetical protein